MNSFAITTIRDASHDVDAVSDTFECGLSKRTSHLGDAQLKLLDPEKATARVAARTEVRGNAALDETAFTEYAVVGSIVIPPRAVIGPCIEAASIAIVIVRFMERVGSIIAAWCSYCRVSIYVTSAVERNSPVAIATRFLS